MFLHVLVALLRLTSLPSWEIVTEKNLKSLIAAELLVFLFVVIFD